MAVAFGGSGGGGGGQTGQLEKLYRPVARRVQWVQLHPLRVPLHPLGLRLAVGTLCTGQTILSSSARSVTNGEMKQGALDPHHRELQVDIS